jgi:hypothetical protein
MTTRKPKPNLLYVSDSSTPWLQLAVVTTENNPSLRHARQWQGVARFAGYQAGGFSLPKPANPRKH